MNKTRNFTCFFFNINLEKTEDVYITNVLTCILNLAFSLLTVVGNFVILQAIHKTRDLHSPSFILLYGLAFSDLLVGAICQPFLVATKIAELVDNFSLYCTFRLFQSMSGWITSGVSSVILAVVSVDRLLAVTLHLRYNAIVTVPRIRFTFFVLWIVFITAVLSRFIISSWEIFPLMTLFLTFLVTAFSTSKIFHIARRHQRQINDQNMAALNLQSNTVNVLKCKRSAVTILYVYGLFLIVYIPLFVTILVDALIGYTRAVKIAYDHVTTAVFINSCLNPLVYCWRIRDIRRAVKNVLRRQ